jgi:hydroxyacylglutathione hydrolase
LLRVAPIPAFTDNYLWLIHDHACAVVVDPGDATPVIDFLVAHDLALLGILVTHHHADHVGGIGALLDWCGRNIPVYGPANEPIPHRSHTVGEGDVVRFAPLSLTLNVMSLPGHTIGHIAYHDEARQRLFSGDTIFAAGCGRLLGGSAEELHRALMRIAALPPDTQLYGTHEYTLSNLKFALVVDTDNAALVARNEREGAKRARNEPTLPTTVALERATNPFLRCAENNIKLAVQRGFSANLPSNASPMLVFTALREWKNHFK